MSSSIDSKQHTHRWLSGIASGNNFNYIIAQKDIHGDRLIVISNQNVQFHTGIGISHFMDKWSPEHIPWYIIPNTSPILLAPLREPSKTKKNDVIENVQGDKYTWIPYKDENIHIGSKLPDYLRGLDEIQPNVQYSSVFSMMLHARPKFLEKVYIISAICENVIYHAGVKDGQLQSGFAHEFITPEDALYFTLFYYKQLKADPKEVPLHFVNMPNDIETRSLLERYVKEIKHHTSILGSERWKSGYLAKHFFQQFHLSCVL